MARRRGGRGTGTLTGAGGRAAPASAPTAVHRGVRGRRAASRARTTSAWSPTDLWHRLDDGWRLALGLLAVQRVVLGIVAVLAVALAADRDLGGEWEQYLIRGGEPWSLFLSTWQRWDGLWYQRILEDGYGVGDSTTNFYPLYPLLGKVVSLLLFGHSVWAALIVSSVAFAVAAWLLYRLTWEQVAPHGQPAGGPRTGLLAAPSQAGAAATLAVLLLVFFPTGFFLLAPFTESLFLALTLATFWFAHRRQWWLAGAAGFLAALTRANGAALVFPLAFMYLHDRGAWHWLRRAGGQPPGLALLATVLPLAGALAWSAFVAFGVGERRRTVFTRGLDLLTERLTGRAPSPLSPSSLDRTGPRSWEFAWPWESLRASIENIGEGFSYLVTSRPGVPPESLVGVEVLNLVSLLVCCALAVLVVRRLPFAYSLYLWPNLAVLLTRQMEFQPLLSTGRYVLALFPCFMVVGILLRSSVRFVIPWLVVSALLQLVLLTYFTRWRFVA